MRFGIHAGPQDTSRGSTRSCARRSVARVPGADAAAVQRQEEDLRLRFGPMTDLVRPGTLTGTPAQVIERLREYEAVGAAWTILALRAPFDWEGLELFTREVMPGFR